MLELSNLLGGVECLLGHLRFDSLPLELSNLFGPLAVLGVECQTYSASPFGPPGRNKEAPFDSSCLGISELPPWLEPLGVNSAEVPWVMERSNALAQVFFVVVCLREFEGSCRKEGCESVCMCVCVFVCARVRVRMCACVIQI